MQHPVYSKILLRISYRSPSRLTHQTYASVKPDLLSEAADARGSPDPSFSAYSLGSSPDLWEDAAATAPLPVSDQQGAPSPRRTKFRVGVRPGGRERRWDWKRGVGSQMEVVPSPRGGKEGGRVSPASFPPVEALLRFSRSSAAPARCYDSPLAVGYRAGRPPQRRAGC